MALGWKDMNLSGWPPSGGTISVHPVGSRSGRGTGGTIGVLQNGFPGKDDLPASPGIVRASGEPELGRLSYRGEGLGFDVTLARSRKEGLAGCP